MKKDNRIDLKHNLILIYNRETRKWDDRSESITALYKAYYYGNFSGYNVYFRGASKGFFYVPKNIRVLKMLKEIDIKNQKYIVNDLLINPTKIESYQFNYYKIYENNRSYITNRLRSVNVETTNNFDYYVGLAKYAKFITNEDEPLRHLANTYEKIKLNTSSVLYDFFEKDITKNPATKLIVPFVFDLSQQEAIKKALEHNISIIEGPPGTGKTQTIINLIANILLKGQNVAVVSNNNTAVENVIEGLNQIQVNPKANLTFSIALRSILRQDPNIIMIGEIRDEETAQIAIRAAITGHLVLATLHTNDSIGTFERLVDMGAPTYLVADAMIGAIAQRLVRKLCPKCKKEHDTTKAEMHYLGIKTKAKIMKPVGCASCNHTGYQGRTAVFEILEMSDSLKSFLSHERRSPEELTELLKKQGMKFLQDSARDLVLEGVTSFEEFANL